MNKHSFARRSVVSRRLERIAKRLVTMPITANGAAPKIVRPEDMELMDECRKLSEHVLSVAERLKR